MLAGFMVCDHVSSGNRDMSILLNSCMSYGFFSKTVTVYTAASLVKAGLRSIVIVSSPISLTITIVSPKTYFSPTSGSNPMLS